MPPDNDRLTATFSALADPTRRAILARLTLGETAVGELAEPFDMSLPAISKHLKVLEAAGFIEQSRAGRSRPRRLKVEALRATREWFDQVADLWSNSVFNRLDALLAAAPIAAALALAAGRGVVLWQ